LLTNPRLLLRLEGLALLVVTLALYYGIEGSWLMFGLLFLVPDLSLFGYLGSQRLGAAAYNLVHTEVFPLALGFAGIVLPHRLAGAVALIWLAHIGIDRLLGLGLKYPTTQKDTHFGRL
jgi:hypothetical protein